MSATQTLVSYFSVGSFSGSVHCNRIKMYVYCSLECLQTDPHFSGFSFGSYLFFLASLTAQGLSLQGMQPWTTTCSQVFFDVISNFLFFNFGGDLPLMDFNLWWSFPSDGVILHTASALHSGGGFLLLLLLCSPCPLWWSDGYWHRPVHTATQLNRLSTDLLATDSRVRSPLTTILVCLLLLLSSEKKKSWLCSDWL